MGWFSAIVGFLGGGGSGNGPDNVMKVASGVGGWIDGLKLTDQERMEFDGKMAGVYAGYIQSTVDENTERSRTRRNIAIWVIRFEILLLTLSILLFKIDPSWSEYIFKIATNSPMDFLVLGIGAFFFGAHLVRATKGN